VGIGLNRETKSAGKSEVCQLDVLATGIDQQILGLQISVENAVLVQVNQRLEDLVEKSLSLFPGQGCISLSPHVFFQIKLQVLEHQIQLLLTVNNLFQPIIG
jgi:hypothetical protein